MNKLCKKILLALFVSILMIMTVATVNAETTPKTDDKATGDIIIESKEKSVNYKITWNCNGGKIGSKKTVITTVKKGSKIKNLVSTPKRSGYIFNGWYTKKNGGTKISKNTVPKMDVIYYAQWTKTGVASKIWGNWQMGYWRYNNLTGKYNMTQQNYFFHANGSFQYFDIDNTSQKFEGKYSVSNGKVYFIECKHYSMSSSNTIKNIEKFGKKNPSKWTGPWSPVVPNRYGKMTTEYKLVSNKDGIFLSIKPISIGDYFHIGTTDTFRKIS